MHVAISGYHCSYDSYRSINCDMETDGGGWTVFTELRMDGIQSVIKPFYILNEVGDLEEEL